MAYGEKYKNKPTFTNADRVYDIVNLKSNADKQTFGGTITLLFGSVSLIREQIKALEYGTHKMGRVILNATEVPGLMQELRQESYRLFTMGILVQICCTAMVMNFARRMGFGQVCRLPHRVTFRLEEGIDLVTLFLLKEHFP